MSKLEKFLILLFIICVLSAFTSIFWNGFSDEISKILTRDNNEKVVVEPVKSKLDNFIFEKNNFIVTGTSLSTVEIWLIPAGKNVTTTDYIKLGEAKKNPSSGLNAWILAVPSEPREAEEIFAKALDVDGKECGRMSLPYRGAIEISSAIWGVQSVEKKKLSLADNGKSFSHGLDSSFSIMLDSEKYPPEELLCEPDGIIFETSSEADPASTYFTKNFFGKATGTCRFINDDFSLNIKIFDSNMPSEYYEKTKYGLSFSYPSEEIVSDNDQNQFLTKNILNRIDLSANNFIGTNLGEASFIVGVTSNKAILNICLESGIGEEQQANRIINGIDYSVFKSSEAGAGNRFQTLSFRTIKNDRCYEAVEFMHWGDINNYPVGTVKEFDQALIQAKLDKILETLIIE
ncbi:MAG: hypothetical protein Q7T50_04520 [Candidatus Magasanikbacteria bacterium]|nr:hypothetical protein [Candidatus Magasanikbacteria bacterium]